MTQENNYRYPGSRPFNDTDLDRRVFFGRDGEIKYLFHSILVENLFVLFGKSGMGKTSLLNAGLMEMLRLSDFLPLTLRFNDREITPLEAIYPGIEEAVKQGNEKFDDQHKIDYEPGEKDSLWQYFKTANFWSPDDKSLTPVLIFDQFEEFFTLHSQKSRESFISQLADLVRGRVPKTLRKIFRSKGYFPYSEKPPKVKIVISIREDYLGDLEELSCEIPNILKNSFRLLPLNCQQAKDAIIKPAQLSENDYIHSKGFSYAPETVDEMLDFLCERIEMGKPIKTNEVEPFQLQLLCRHLEEEVIKKAAKESTSYIVRKSDLGGKEGMKKVLQGFYEDRIKDLVSLRKKRRVRRLCEKGLIDRKRESRVSLKQGRITDKYKVSKELLSQLVDSRLLRSEPRVGSVYYELSHDTLVEPILKYHRRRAIEKSWIIVSALAFFLLIGANFIREQINRYITIDRLYEEAGEFKQLGSYTEAIDRYSRILKISKKRVSLYMEIGELFERFGDHDNAIENYKNALDYKGKVNQKIANYRLGKIYANNKKIPKKAVKYYKKAIEIDPEQVEFHIALGDLYREQKKFEDAEEEYDSALELGHRIDAAYRGLALTYINQERPEKSMEIYRKAVGFDVEFANFYRDMAMEFKKRREVENLGNLYRAAYEVNSIDPAYYKDLGDDFESLHKYDNAIECYEKAVGLGDRSESIFVRLALVYINLEKPDEAIRVYREAVKAKFDHAYIYSDIARSMREKGRVRDLERLYQAASEVQTSDAAYYEKLGYAFVSLKEYDRAIANYKKALGLDEKRASIYTRLAVLYVNQGNFHKAIDVYLDAIKVSTDYVYIIKNISWEMEKRKSGADRKKLYQIAYRFDTTEAAYYEQLGTAFNYLKEYYWTAVTFKKVTKINPGNTNAWLRQGVAYRKLYNYDRAIYCYEKAIQLGSKNASTYNMLGVAYGRKGDYYKARKAYKKALKVEPYNMTIRANLAEVTLAAGYFKESFDMANQILKKRVSSMYRLAMKFISVSSLVFQDKRLKTHTELHDLITYYKSLPRIKPWTYAVSKKFIRGDPRLKVVERELLLELIKILESPRKIGLEKLEKFERKVEETFGDLSAQQTEPKPQEAVDKK